MVFLIFPNGNICGNLLIIMIKTDVCASTKISPYLFNSDPEIQL